MHASIPVINALTDDDHPTQLLADWLTIRETFGKDISGRKFVYLGDGNNMANAWLVMGAIMGAHVVAATPQGTWAPNMEYVELAKSIAKRVVARLKLFMMQMKQHAVQAFSIQMYGCLWGFRIR